MRSHGCRYQSLLRAIQNEFNFLRLKSLIHSLGIAELKLN